MLIEQGIYLYNQASALLLKGWRELQHGVFLGSLATLVAIKSPVIILLTPYRRSD